ncbi:MAG TPA: PAS domain S-box protein, partial [Candidatus Acidoferrales bacterium]|nr:PAS domain S-box protein [Candidatus Acidoferrales bacterium]
AAVFPQSLGEDSYFTTAELVIYRPIWLDGQRIGTVYIQSDLEDIRDRLRRFAGIVSLVVLGCLILVYVMGGLLKNAVLNPIQELSAAMQSVAREKNYSLRAAKHADDELGHLADGFNHMLQQIELRDGDLREARDTLEKRVAERTLELREEISERLRAEQALSQSEETTRLLLDSTAEAIYGVGLQGECTFANPSCLRMLGYDDAEELLGKNMHALIHHTRDDGRLYPVTECRLAEAFRLGLRKHVDDEVFWRRDGSSFPAEYWSFPILRGKHVTGAVVTFLDITDRRQTEKELEQRTGFLNTLIEVSPLPIVVEDLTPRIVLCNEAFEKLFGFTMEEAAKFSIDALVSTPELRAEAEALTGQVRSTGTVHKIARRRRKDGSLVDVEIHGVALRAGGKLAGQFALYQDITERKKKEKELQEAKEAAESASRAKSEFLANMSHEIRTPLNAVMGMTDLILDTELNAEQRDHLDLVRSSANALLGIVNDILDFSKIEARHLELERIPFGLRETLGDILKMLAVRAQQKSLKLGLEIVPEAPENLVGDPGRLRQILVNLIGNGIKFTESGEVIVRVRGRSVQAGEADLEFAVSDTGTGIAKEMHSKIFEAFSQADSSTTRKYGGTGLGLSITAQLVKLMGGEIQLESELGRGSTFRFTVKFQVSGKPELKTSSSSPETPPAKIQARSGNPPSMGVPTGLQFLLAEDNAVNQRLAIGLLEKCGNRVAVAANGREVLEALHRQSFDAVLMDVQMPEMGGLEATRLIRQREKFLGGHIPIIAMTAHAMKGDREKCLEAGMDGYVSKPIRPDALFGEIKKHMKTANQAQQSPPPVQSAESHDPVLDTADVLNRVAGDAELLAELVSVFRGDCPQQMQLLRESVGASDAHSVERTAHALKGALANLGALRARKVAAQLEQMGRGGDLQGAAEVCAALEREIAQLEQALDKLCVEVAR